MLAWHACALWHQRCLGQEIEDDARWASVAKTDVCQRWWKCVMLGKRCSTGPRPDNDGRRRVRAYASRRYMSSVMPANADHSPVASPLKEVFHMD